MANNATDLYSAPPELEEVVTERLEIYPGMTARSNSTSTMAEAKAATTEEWNRELKEEREFERTIDMAEEKLVAIEESNRNTLHSHELGGRNLFSSN